MAFTLKILLFALPSSILFTGDGSYAERTIWTGEEYGFGQPFTEEEDESSGDVIHGNWGAWNSWTKCTKKCCGSEKRTRVRFCNNPSPDGGGRPCEGLAIETKDCTTDISKICIHSNYSGTTMDYDLAMLKLGSSIPYDDDEAISSICLPCSRKNFKAGTLCFVTGWGRISESGRTSNELRVARILIIDKERCQELYRAEAITPRMLCAGYDEGRVDSCQGDSGGPLVCRENGTLVLVGAVSWGFGCAKEGKPGVYTNLIPRRSWIDDIMSRE